MTDPALLVDLTSSSARARRAAIEALEALGWTGEEAAVAIARVALRDPSQAVRASAARAVPLVDTKGASAPTMLEALQDPDPAPRLRAAELLEALGALARQASLALCGSALHDSEDAVRAAAAHSLGAVDLEGEALPDLVAALGRDVEVAHRAAVSLAGYAERAAPAVPELIATFVTARDPELRRAVILGFHRIGPAARDAAPILTAALDDPELRIFAELALAAISLA